jgi:hypothetical protein
MVGKLTARERTGELDVGAEQKDERRDQKFATREAEGVCV